MASTHLHLTLLTIFFFLSVVTTLGLTETQVLTQFKASLLNADAPLKNWIASGVPCVGATPHFTGVICTNDGKVWGLQLENMSLAGVINFDLLTGLPNLRTLSFMNNSFEGPMPTINKLAAMKSFYLSNNRFSGEIADNAFDNTVWLKNVWLAQNEFTGSIPSSLTRVPRLLELRLDANQFQGKIPDFPQKDLQMVNVSHNHLHGEIPKSLRKMDSSLFSGNDGLCGSPLKSCKKKPKWNF